MLDSRKLIYWFYVVLALILLAIPRESSAEYTTIDIMLVYDTTASAWVEDNGGSMELFSQDAVNRMNAVIQNSGVDLTFNLVHYMSVQYTSLSNLSSDLQALQSGSGSFATVHQARDVYGADLVALLVDTGSAWGHVGRGYMLDSWDGRPNQAFTVNAIQSVDISHTLTHEVGHNLGAHHSKNQADSPGPNAQLTNPGAPYSAGWYFTGTNNVQYHTIMAYNDDGYGNTYQSAPLFSTPLIHYQGRLSGDEEDGDNVRLIFITKDIIAGYRTINTYDICEAVGHCDLLWGSGGDAQWSLDSSDSTYEDSSLKSGSIGDSEETWLKTVVQGPGELSFDWKVSSRESHDFLSFYLGEERKERISGELDWHKIIISIPAGTHTLKWEYSKSSSWWSSAGQDAGWIDKVKYTPSYYESMIGSKAVAFVENGEKIIEGPYENIVSEDIEFIFGLNTVVDCKIDIQSHTILIDYSLSNKSGRFATSSFNGYRIFFPESNFIIYKAEIIQEETTLNITEDRLIYNDNEISVNVSSLYYTPSDRIKIFVYAEEKGYDLNVNSTGIQKVSIEAIPSRYGGTTNYKKLEIPKSTKVTLIAPSTKGEANFNRWTGCDSTNTGNRTCTVTMNSNKTVTAQYDSDASLALPGVLMLLLDDDE